MAATANSSAASQFSTKNRAMVQQIPVIIPPVVMYLFFTMTPVIVAAKPKRTAVKKPLYGGAINAKVVASAVANMPYIIQMWPIVLLMKLVIALTSLPLSCARVNGQPITGIPNQRKFQFGLFVSLNMNHIKSEKTRTMHPQVTSGVPAFFSKSFLLLAMASLIIWRLFSGDMLLSSIM